MKKCTIEVPTEPEATAAPATNADGLLSDTCDGRDAGTYPIANVLNVFCDGTGRALIHHTAGTGCTVSAVRESTSVNASVNSCAYRPDAEVRLLAQHTVGVELEDATDGTLHTATTSDQRVIDALRHGTSWQAFAFEGSNGDAVWTGDFAFTPPRANCVIDSSGWPHMYHACGIIGGVHWLFNDQNRVHGREYRGLPKESRTYLRMKKCTIEVPTEPEATAAPATNADCLLSDTCDGRDPGTYPIANVLNVFCNGNGRALIHHTAGTGCTVSAVRESTSVNASVNSCAYRPDAEVRLLAQHTVGVELEDATDGTLHTATSSDQRVIDALRHGTSWQAFAFEGVNGDAVWAGDFAFMPPKANCIIDSTSWPHMYHACGQGAGVHWLFNGQTRVHGREYNGMPKESRTYLRMKKCITDKGS